MPSSKKVPSVTDRLQAIDYLLRESSRFTDREEAGLLEQIESIVLGRATNLSPANLEKLIKKAERFGLETRRKK